jgi:peptidoglycan/xylan/chitin deacetylase (PgdA/CDA1 family)
MTSVLAFHTVTDSAWFEDLVRWLVREYSLVSLEALVGKLAARSGARKVCHITVDDGDKSFVDVMLPVLSKYGVPASLFVSPEACCQGTNFWFQEIDGYQARLIQGVAAAALDVPEQLAARYSPETILKAMPLRKIREVIAAYQRQTGAPKKAGRNISSTVLKDLATSGLVSVGAHTMNHPILANESSACARHEISASVGDLSALLGRPVWHFAYPNGIPNLDFGPRECAVLRDAGVRMAFTTESRHAGPDEDWLRVPRIAVSDRESMPQIRAKLLLGSAWGPLKRLARTGEYVERRRFWRAVQKFRSNPLPPAFERDIPLSE